MAKTPECDCASYWAEYYTEHPSRQIIHEVHEYGCEYAIAMLKQQDEADEDIRQALWEEAVTRGDYDESNS